MKILQLVVDGLTVTLYKEDYLKLCCPRLAVYADGRGGMQNVRILGQKETRYLHKEIYGEIPVGYVVDHIDRNPLNNLRENLRLATVAQNNRNNDQAASALSGLKGVSWYSKRSCWRAAISIQGTKMHLGYFACKYQAFEAYKKASIEHYGEFSPFYCTTSL